MAQRLDPDAAWSGIQVHLVDDHTMRDTHQAVFQRDAVTDVISQRYAPMPPDFLLEGEIIINIQQAHRARPRAGWTPGHELALYTAHGIDHLHGANDASPQEHQRMRRRELRWLRSLAQSGLSYQNLLPQ